MAALNQLVDGRKVALKPETFAEIKCILTYLRIFECLLLSSVWFKVLQSIYIRNKVLQTKNIILDIKERLINDLVNDLNRIRDSFDKIVEEAEAIASVTEVPTFKEIEAEQTGKATAYLQFVRGNVKHFLMSRMMSMM